MKRLAVIAATIIIAPQLAPSSPARCGLEAKKDQTKDGGSVAMKRCSPKRLSSQRKKEQPVAADAATA